MRTPSPFEEATAQHLKERPYTDDDVLDWWTAYDNGNHYINIARAANQSPTVIRRELDALGVWVGPVLDKRVEKLKAAGGSAEAIDLLLRHERGELTSEEQYLWGLVGRMGGGIASEGVEGRQVAYARSMQHVKPNARSRYPMSERERGHSKLGWGAHRRAVRAELRSAGLLPRAGVQSRRIGRYWL